MSEIPEPLPRIARFEKLGFGMFIHWGLYSQLGAGEWVMNQRRIPSSDYNKLVEGFTAVDFDADAIARTAKSAGMRYIVLTTRHHDGFSLYDTRGLSTFDSLHSPAARDLVGEFAEACRKEEVVPFFYHTTLDWQWDSDFHAHPAGCDRFEAYLEYLNASVEVLCRNYGPIGGLWFDGNWAYPEADWREDRLYATIRRHQPEALIINNTGLSARGALGHPEIDSTTFEQGLPTAPDRRGQPKYLAGEMCQTMNAHWGIGENDFRYLSIGQIIENLCLSRKVGANYLLNVGPTANGAIPDYESAALRRVGDWLRPNAEIIYQGEPVAGTSSNGRDFLLRRGDDYYYFAFDLGMEGSEHVTSGDGVFGPRTYTGLPRKFSTVRWLDNEECVPVDCEAVPGAMTFKPTFFPYGTHRVVRVGRLMP